MALHAVAKPRRDPVTLGFLGGGTRVGSLGPFDPVDSDLTLEVDDGTPRAKRVVVPAERLAYIAFTGPKPPARHRGLTQVRVHVAGGDSFEVSADPQVFDHPLGFWGTPDPDASDFTAIFFYAAGVCAKENPALLGEMLVEAGVIAPSAIENGVAAQTKDKTTPLGQILVEQGRVRPEEVDEACARQNRKKMRIGEILVDAGLATDEDIERALAEQKLRKGKRLGDVLVQMGVLTEVDLALTLAAKFHLPYVNLDEIQIQSAALREVPRHVIEQFGVLPVEADAQFLTIAISDPLGIEAIEAVRMHQPKRVREVMATPSQLRRFVQACLAGSHVNTGAEEFDRILEQLQRDESSSGTDTGRDDDTSAGASDSAVIKLVNQVILDAYRRGASDIHVEPNGKERNTMIRFRIDGSCVTYQEVPQTLRSPLVARLKIMAQLDIAERRKPQDGKIRFRVQDKFIELRVATIPTTNGNEDVVMRILASSKPLQIASLGFSDRNRAAVEAVIRKPYGLFLCVGPTGSGKTTTLHSALGALNAGDRKIWTAEDPVEITQPGLRQVQVNPKIGVTFAASMRAFLRADPDIIMVGEMRDHETAAVAIEASLTGHLVMSTLHTNNAPESVTRLIDMGLDPFSFGDALLAVLAQRLTRALCRRCREPFDATPADYAQMALAYGAERLARDLEIHSAADLRLYRPRGCDACGGTGYRGRLALHELLVCTPEIQEAIHRKAPANELRRLAEANGMTTLLRDGIDKCRTGETCFSQVLAVCSR